MMRFRGLSFILALIFPAIQQVRVHTLSAPNAEFPVPFSEILGLRELSNGTLVVNDHREQELRLVDMQARTARKIGSTGSGPGEYRIALSVVALPGDTTAIYDMGSARMVLIRPDGSTAPYPRAAAESPSGRLTDDSRSDSRGRIYTTRRIDGTDSSAIERLDRVTGKRDTVARIYARLISPDPSQATRGVRPTGESRLYATADQWAVASDGRVAIVTPYPYQVTFIETDARRVRTPVIPSENLRLSEAHKQQWRARQGRPVPTMSVSRGEVRVEFRSHPTGEPAEWPEYLPPFTINSVSFAPDGVLWIRRTVAATAPPVFDLIDRTGLVAKVTIPFNSRLVGFGARSVYLARIDNDDLEHLQRYAWPR